VKPERLDIASMQEALVAPVETWASAAVTSAVRDELGLDPVCPGPLPIGTRTLVVCGGGTLIDRAKATARRQPEPVRVVAAPTLWGAGAEASPVVVLNGKNGVKEVLSDDVFIPDARVVWPGPSSAAPEQLRRAGSGDVWGHTLETLISPLADASVRADAADLVHALLPLTPDGENAVLWLDLSARACALQARASVGLAHGIAHQLEGPLGIGHARLVAAALPTVFALAVAEAPRWPDVAAAYGLDAERISARLASLVDFDDLAAVQAAAPEHWRAILRDPLTRTNGFLVRPAHLHAFEKIEL
jgi:alcohol dehydrogenase class IV